MVGTAQLQKMAMQLMVYPVVLIIEAKLIVGIDVNHFEKL